MGCPLLGRPFIDRPLFARSSCKRHNMHVLAAEFAVAERHTAVGKGEKGMILAHADAGARVPLRATLTNDDVAGARRLAAKELYAQALAFTVAAVAGRSAGVVFLN